MKNYVYAVMNIEQGENDLFFTNAETEKDAITQEVPTWLSDKTASEISSWEEFAEKMQEFGYTVSELKEM